MPDPAPPDLPASHFASTAPWIAWHALHRPHALAIVEDALRVDYETMAADLVRCVLAIERMRVTPAMLVGVALRPDRYLHLLLLLACEVVGASSVSLTEQDLSDGDPILRRCGMLLVGDVQGTNRHVIPAGWLDDLRRQALPPGAMQVLERPVVPEQTARIVRTSGTTGRPKAMAISHALQQRLVLRHMERLAAAAPAVSLCLYNLAVRSVHVRVLGFLQHGGTLIFGRESYVGQLFAAGIVDHMALTLGDAERIVRHAERPPAGHRMHIELIGARVTPDLLALIRERLGAKVSTRYSSNETSMISATDDENVGTLCPGVEVRIVDDAGNDLPPEQTGLIRVRTDSMVAGYLDDPAATAAAFIDGWYDTRDAGYIPEPGKLVVLGRADDMLNLGGVKLAPGPMEDSIKRLAGVTDAALLTVVSPNGIDALLVAVEVADQGPPAGLSADLQALLSTFVHDFSVMTLRRFPRTLTGKVQRGEIRNAFLRGGGRVS